MTENTPDKQPREGLPVWMPLVGLLAAFFVALAVGASICPTLSALVMPPGPRLPPGTMHEKLHESHAAGEDEWLYGTDLDGCAVAQFYVDWLKDCTFAPVVTCHGGSTANVIGEPGQSYHVATCVGKQVIGNYSLAWTVYIDSGYASGDKTSFRLIREVSN